MSTPQHQLSGEERPELHPTRSASSTSTSGQTASHSDYQQHSPVPNLPPAPHPSSDLDAGSHSTVMPGTLNQVPYTGPFKNASPSPRTAAEILRQHPSQITDIFAVSPAFALTLLSRSVEAIVRVTNVDASPQLNATKFISIPEEGEAPKEELSSPVSTTSDRIDSPGSEYQSEYHFDSTDCESVDGVELKPRRRSSQLSESVNLSRERSQSMSPRRLEFDRSIKIINSNLGDMQAQETVITRKFWSKKAPEISIEDYLFRIHSFCPLSTSTILAASLYLHRLCASPPTLVPLTRRTVHRTLCAALRVASKELEDVSHGHRRFAGVAGVSERELARLEISFCYLINWDLKVRKEILEEEGARLRAELIRHANSVGSSSPKGSPVIRAVDLGELNIPMGRLGRPKASSMSSTASPMSHSKMIQDATPRQRKQSAPTVGAQATSPTASLRRQPILLDV